VVVVVVVVVKSDDCRRRQRPQYFMGKDENHHIEKSQLKATLQSQTWLIKYGYVGHPFMQTVPNTNSESFLLTTFYV
jgi:hypothetical protein